MKSHTRKLRMKDFKIYLKGHRSCVCELRMCEKKAFQMAWIQLAELELAVERAGMSASRIRITFQQPFQLIQFLLAFFFSTA